MKELTVVVYTMKGCPFCDDFKKMLQEENVEFHDRDIEEYDKEYETYVEITENEYIPALLLIESEGEKYESFLYAPERDYNELKEALNIIQGHRKNLLG
jgi:glutaredoxin